MHYWKNRKIGLYANLGHFSAEEIWEKYEDSNRRKIKDLKQINAKKMPTRMRRGIYFRRKWTLDCDMEGMSPGVRMKQLQKERYERIKNNLKKMWVYVYLKLGGAYFDRFLAGVRIKLESVSNCITKIFRKFLEWVNFGRGLISKPVTTRKASKRVSQVSKQSKKSSQRKISQQTEDLELPPNLKKKPGGKSKREAKSEKKYSLQELAKQNDEIIEKARQNDEQLKVASTNLRKVPKGTRKTHRKNSVKSKFTNKLGSFQRSAFEVDNNDKTKIDETSFKINVFQIFGKKNQVNGNDVYEHEYEFENARKGSNFSFTNSSMTNEMKTYFENSETESNGDISEDFDIDRIKEVTDCKQDISNNPDSRNLKLAFEQWPSVNTNHEQDKSENNLNNNQTTN